ncbi:hypothetical protein NCDO763_1081 [Lactococcus cremoris]|nr:hypothetical protein LLNZ_01505 [Lactococcus cremoris subsp. cremoris NZ9000]KZK52051.1 hypothetical protein NCDO763_1081 [Lactococcus cremoris]
MEKGLFCEFIHKKRPYGLIFLFFTGLKLYRKLILLDFH